MLHAHVRHSCRYEEVFQNMKYLYLRYYNEVVTPGTDFFNDLSVARSRRQLCEVLDAYASSSGDPASSPEAAFGLARRAEGDSGEEGEECAGAGGIPSLVAFYDALVARCAISDLPVPVRSRPPGRREPHLYSERRGHCLMCAISDQARRQGPLRGGGVGQGRSEAP